MLQEQNYMIVSELMSHKFCKAFCSFTLDFSNLGIEFEGIGFWSGVMAQQVKVLTPKLMT